ncbi:uncharacterized protein LOC117895840 [Drosophila subobscura]|uniref:uncharacterized protein LOC117895840 n=1 Tax=Drosophila subobscura TaxID=7241 RepID=UPI00155ABD09|nr:uncharacterized protein LOC117895840 [Drosophila subobscura]
MWEYRQDMHFQTRLKMNPFCKEWKSACWFMLNGFELYNSVMQELLSVVLVAIAGVILVVLKQWLNHVNREQQTAPEPSASDNFPEETQSQVLKEPVLAHQISEYEMCQVFQDSSPAHHVETQANPFTSIYRDPSNVLPVVPIASVAGYLMESCTNSNSSRQVSETHPRTQPKIGNKPQLLAAKTTSPKPKPKPTWRL